MHLKEELHQKLNEKEELSDDIDDMFEEIEELKD